VHQFVAISGAYCGYQSVEPPLQSTYNARARNEEETRVADGKGSMARQPVAGAEIARPPVHRITVAQLAVLVPLCLITWLVVNSVSAYSLLCGALVSILPQAWFASIAFRRRGARRAQQAARMVYAGELGKFLLSVAGFALVFAVVRPIDAPAVFAGFLCMLGIQIYGSWRLLR
jgi:ATP synthase protein I